MNEKLENAFKHIDMTYQELVEIADSLTQPVFAPINQIVNSLTNTGYLLSFLLFLFHSYCFSRFFSVNL